MKVSKKSIWISLVVIPIIIVVLLAYITQNPFTILYMWPTCLITGLLIFKLDYKQSWRFIIYIGYSIIYNIVLASLYLLIYTRVLGGDIVI